MQQLQNIFHQRKSDQTQLSTLTDINMVKSKQQYMNRQKLRIQNENWILKLIKTVKNPPLDTKKNIYITMVNMMKQYTEMQSEQIQYQTKFTECFINLFVKFYNKNAQSENNNNLKIIVRPNNIFIIYDLIKTFVEFTRDKFKRQWSTTYKNQLEKENTYSKFTVFRRISSQKQEKLNNIIADDIKIQQSQIEIKDIDMPELIQKGVKETHFDRCYKFVTNNDCQILEEKINQVFIQLIKLNDTNRSIISSYKDHCFGGNKRNLNYNFSGLYTNEQKQKMINKLQNSIDTYDKKSKPFGKCTSDELRQHFKSYQQIEQNKLKIYKKSNNENINGYINLRIEQIPNVDILLSLVIPINKQYLSLKKFKQTKKQTINEYLVDRLNQKFDKEKGQQYLWFMDKRYRRFKKQLFVDVNKKKIKELLFQQKISPTKKDILLPQIPNKTTIQCKQRRSTQGNNIIKLQLSQQRLQPLAIKFSPQNKNKLKLRKANTSLSQVKMIAAISKTELCPQINHNIMTRQKHLSTYHI